jgi:hypothetical protein
MRIFLFAGALLLALLPIVASAQEVRDVGEGRFTVEIGFRDEPTYLGLPNALFLEVTEYGSEGGPVEGLAATLEAEVTKEGATMPLPLVPQAEPGVYQAGFIPTALGDYTFRVFGQVGGAEVDEAFSSSPTTFAPVEPLALVQFPVDAPAGEELVGQLNEATTAAHGARTLAAVGIGAGAVGILVGVVSCSGDGAGPPPPRASKWGTLARPARSPFSLGIAGLVAALLAGCSSPPRRRRSNRRSPRCRQRPRLPSRSRRRR